jgi:hypothetical protein
VNCGHYTLRRVKVHYHTAHGDGDRGKQIADIGLGLGFFGLLGTMMGLLWQGRSGHKHLAIDLPQCELCAAHGSPQPRYVDFDNHRMVFVVHKKFQQAFARPMH